MMVSPRSAGVTPPEHRFPSAMSALLTNISTFGKVKMNKDRLYVALYKKPTKASLGRAGSTNVSAPSGEDEFRWGLLLAPKALPQTVNYEPTHKQIGTLFHAHSYPQNNFTPATTINSLWTLQSLRPSPAAIKNLYVRVYIGKITNRAALESFLEAVPLRPYERGFSSAEWVRDALVGLSAGEKNDMDGLIKRGAVLNWVRVRDCAMGYCRKKIAAGRFEDMDRGGGGVQVWGRRGLLCPVERKCIVPTWDLIKDREIDA